MTSALRVIEAAANGFSVALVFPGLLIALDAEADSHVPDPRGMI
jgi:hypothetical protein